MAAGSTLIVSKQSVTLPIFPVKLQMVQKQKAYSARFHTGWIRLFVLSWGQRKNFLPHIHCSVN